MTISADTLFHFTGTMRNLINILSDDFCPRYCLENQEHIFKTIIKDYRENAFPMVCFCDIPLSQIKKHIGYYGRYCIGLTKEWGRRQGINPVMYYLPEGNPTSYINLSYRKTLESPENGPLIELSDFLKYLKPYEGRLWRDGNYLDEIVRFYDEREWRFVAPARILYDNGLPISLRYDEFMNVKKVKELNYKVSKCCKLSFEPKDIKYIIVDKEDEIPEMVRKVEKIKGKYSHDDVRVLLTRIISMEQVLVDF